jgi:hypothetical protein
MGMQHFIIWVHQVMNGSFISKGSKTRTWVHDQKQIIFSFLQKFAGYIMICSLAVFVLVFKYSRDKVEDLKNPPNLFKHQYVPCLSGGDVSRMTAPLHFICDTFDLDSTTQSRALAFADTCHRHHKMPFFVVRFNQQQLTGFTPGLADSSFRGFFDLLRERYAPVFFSLIAANNCSDSSQLMLSRCLYTISEVADRASFPNVAWVWHSASPPGDPYISYNKHILSWVVVPRDSLVSCGPASIDPKLVIVASPGSMNVWKPSSNQPETLDLALFDRSPSAPAGSQRSLNGFYIKGMAYNPAHDWRDNKNNLPLTRKMLERDFSSIKAMGANTIRRYSSSIYDHNILSIAGEKDLKVLYGFWFDHQNNYLRDNDMKNDYHHQVLDFVARNKNNHTILGWGLGNETWGLLKRDFKEPYLSFVRIEYLDMIEHIAADIKRIDSLHPVFVMDEHTPRLSSSVYAFNRFAPCVDIFGVNSYYKPNIARVDSIMLHASPGKHYLVSEFGPKGYWQTAFNDYMFDTLLKEQDSYSKADWMEEQWKSYIVANKENNVGGVAFCWQDRFECTATWFGITDLYGNKRPAWYALARCFNTPASIPAQAAPSPFPVPRFFIVSSINTQWAGLTTRVSAITRRADSSSRANLWYKWMILEEGTFKKLHETEFVRGASEFTYKIPSTNAPCRLYLYVSDMNGNVISESKPLVIRTY